LDLEEDKLEQEWAFGWIEKVDCVGEDRPWAWS